MQNFRQKSSLVLDILIAVMVLGAWMCMIFKWGDNGTISQGGFRNLKYFTVLSNLLMAAASILNIIYTQRSKRTGKDIPSWISKLKYTGASAVSLTFIVVIAFLWPVYNVPGLYSGANLFFYGIVPITSVIAVIVGEGETVSFRDSFIAVIPMVLYGTGYILNILINGFGETPYSNDWYGFLYCGWGIGLGIFGILILITWAVALLIIKLNENTPTSKSGGMNRSTSAEGRRIRIL